MRARGLFEFTQICTVPATVTGTVEHANAVSMMLTAAADRPR